MAEDSLDVVTGAVDFSGKYLTRRLDRTRRYSATRVAANDIIVVSGLPRSGTSLMMNMLQAGGLEVLVDAARPPDLDNPRGYFELARVKSLAADASWLDAAHGKAVKVISALLQHLPEGHHYKVLFMRRALDEVLVSQAHMLEHRGMRRDLAFDPALRAEFAAHLAATDRLLQRRALFEVHDVHYATLMRSPSAAIERITAFLGVELDQATMRAAIDPALHRVRSSSRGVQK